MPQANKHVVVSVGPIPARVDSVKFITNRFKGGLALKTVQRLLDEHGIFVTIVAWKYTDIPYEIERRCEHVFRVADVYEYYDWFVAHAKDYSAFVMAAAVANLTPVKPYEGKFPSHLYKPGEEFDIKFMIAPRAIDAIKDVNPRACLIGYKLFDAPTDAELVDIARHTLDDSRANLIFANTPSQAKTKKLALTQDGSVIPCTFDEHCELIVRAIRQTYYRTKIDPLTETEQDDPDIREALATVECFENSFEKYGTVAVAVENHPGMFATTSRGHKSDPVIVRAVNHEDHTVLASGKATLNAPALSAFLKKVLSGDPDAKIAVHRHVDLSSVQDEGFGSADILLLNNTGNGTFAVARKSKDKPCAYVFPGTVDEVDYVTRTMEITNPGVGVYEPYHGYILPRKIGPVDWTKYYEQFPERYFHVPDRIQEVLDHFKETGEDTLELGGNASSEAKFVYDPYVKSNTAENLSLQEIQARRFPLGYALNAINYLDKPTLAKILSCCDVFIANTFFRPPEKSVRGREAAILDGAAGIMRHTLRLADDNIVRHVFYAYGEVDYNELGLSVLRYGENSAIVYKA